MRLFSTGVATMLAVSAFLLGAAARADDLDAIRAAKTLRIGTEGTYAPFTFHDASGALVGFDVEIGRKVAEQLGVTPQFLEGKWDGLIAGLDNEDAARFAFLLATPIIGAAALLKLPDLLGHLGDGIRGQALVAMVVAAITAVFTVSFLVKYFKTRTLVPFGVYCVLFGLFMLIYTVA